MSLIPESIYNTLYFHFIMVQSWWLDEAPSPEPLFLFRVFAACAAFLSVIMSIYNARRPNEIEKLWDEETCHRFQVISWVRAIGFMMLSSYYLGAIFFEAHRETSPHRLLVLCTGVSVMLVGYLMDALFWRAHYFRKRVMLAKKGEQVQVK